MGAAVGKEVRRLRELRKMSAAGLAREAGLSKATLSKLEAGQGNPTIETIAAIAIALRLPLGDLLPSPVELTPTVRAGTPAPEKSSQELMHRASAGVLTEIWRVRISPQDYRIESPPHSAGTVEHVLVTRGSMLVGPAAEPQVVTAGDFLIFAAGVPHFYQALEPSVEATLVMTYPASSWN